MNLKVHDDLRLLKSGRSRHLLQRILSPSVTISLHAELPSEAISKQSRIRA